MIPEKNRISILLPDLRGGGAERLHVHLGNHWVRNNFDVEFALMLKQGELLEKLDKNISVSELCVSRMRFLLGALVRYLRRTRPDIVVVAMWPLTSISIIAWILAGRPGRIFVSDHSQLSIAAVQEMHVPRWLIGSVMHLTYPFASGVIAVSKGVKEDMCALSGLSASLIRVIYNPVAIGVSGKRGSAETRRSLWGDGFRHHILSVGTLKKQKDHNTLIRAFSLLGPSLNAKLIILGEGSLRSELENLVRELGLEDRVALPGFVLDPYSWYQTADLFVLSSRWEGFGNVIVEALESGVPVVSTNCPSGPSEILQDGEVGRLVPVQDPSALANAMAEMLANPVTQEILIQRARDFSVPKIAEEYLEYFGLNLGSHCRKAS